MAAKSKSAKWRHNFEPSFNKNWFRGGNRTRAQRGVGVVDKICRGIGDGVVVGVVVGFGVSSGVKRFSAANKAAAAAVAFVNGFSPFTLIK